MLSRPFARLGVRCLDHLPKLSQGPALRCFSISPDETAVEDTSLPNRFEGVGQPFEKRISAILTSPLQDDEVCLVET